MRRWLPIALVAVLAASGGAGIGYWLGGRQSAAPVRPATEAPHLHPPPAGERKILYYKDPMGGPETSPVPKKDSMGMDYLPVYADDVAAAAAPAAPPAAPTTFPAERKILYYRNPMGLADTSPTPKKDPMGMDYVPVYADEAADARAGVVSISPERVQMIGVRSEPVGRRDLVRPIRAVGTVQFDERRTYVVSTRYEGWIERLLVNATGETVRRGQPLMQVHSPDLVLAQEEYALIRQSIDAEGAGGASSASRRLLEGATERLRHLDFPPAELERLQRTVEARSSVIIPSPVSGTVIEKPALQGMRFMPGEPLYKIVDMATMWLIAEVYEQDLAHVAVGQPATITLKAYPQRTFSGRVAFVYPNVGEQSRTVRVRIEIPNPENLLKADMYAAVEIAAPASRNNVLAVPESAILDNGVRQMVLLDRGEGRFEPRQVRLGDKAGGFVQVLDGVAAGERVVVSANFLIDAESNLKAALSGFGEQGHQH